MEARRLTIRLGWRGDAGNGWRTAWRLISKRISPEPGCPPSSRGWFQVRPPFSRLRVGSVVKTARWPPQGPAALPGQVGRSADTADGQLSGQEPATALPAGATGVRPPSRRIGRGVRRWDVVTRGGRPAGPCPVLVVRLAPSMRTTGAEHKPRGRPFIVTCGRLPGGTGETVMVPARKVLVCPFSPSQGTLVPGWVAGGAVLAGPWRPAAWSGPSWCTSPGARRSPGPTGRCSRWMVSRAGTSRGPRRSCGGHRECRGS